MFRVIVTGARDLPEAEIVWVPLWMTLHQRRAIIVTHGGNQSGADRYVHDWFRLPGQTFHRTPGEYESAKDELIAIEDAHSAQWGRFGKCAGNIRNQEMVDINPMADVCFAFPTPRSSGTLDCMARAWVRGIPVVVWHHLDLGRWRRLDDDEGQKLARRKLGWGR